MDAIVPEAETKSAGELDAEETALAERNASILGEGPNDRHGRN